MKNRASKPTKTPPAATQAKGPAAQKAQPSDDQIRARAHEIFLKRGSGQGHELEDWIAAERELHKR